MPDLPAQNIPSGADMNRDGHLAMTESWVPTLHILTTYQHVLDKLEKWMRDEFHPNAVMDKGSAKHLGK